MVFGVYEKIHAQLMTCEVMHMDETRIQCNKEEGRKASSNSFMWVMRSARKEAKASGGITADS